MAQTASAIFDIIASQYATDPNKTDYITWARDMTSTCWYGDNTERAIALRAAHMLTLDKRAQDNGGGGEIASKREGDLAISYHKGNTDDNSDLALTPYGRQLAGLRKASGAFIGVTGGRDDGCHD